MEIVKNQRYYFDSNVFIYSIEKIDKNKSSIVQELFDSIVKNDSQVITSELTLGECLVKPRKDNNMLLETLYVDSIFNNKNIFLESIDIEVLFLMADIRAKNNFRTPDAIHIATAVKNNCSAILTNDKQFKALENEDMKVWYLDELLK